LAGKSEGRREGNHVEEVNGRIISKSILKRM
jgi:hypothetical protein